MQVAIKIMKFKLPDESVKKERTKAELSELVKKERAKAEYRRLCECDKDPHIVSSFPFVEQIHRLFYADNHK